MSVRDFRDLICWQLSQELKCDVLAFTATENTSKDFRFCDQIRDSSASATRNIAEGFGRFTPGEFAQYLKWARASLMETMNSLIDARDRGYSEVTKRATAQPPSTLLRSPQHRAAQQPAPDTKASE